MQKESFWVVIPHFVLSDTRLTSTDKIFYGEVSSLTRKSGYCTATNRHFEEVLGISARSIQRSIKNLQDTGYLTIEITRSGDGTYRKMALTGLPTPPKGVKSDVGDKDDGGKGSPNSRKGASKCRPKREIHIRDTNIASIHDLADATFKQELVQKFRLSPTVVQDELDKMIDFIKASGKTYKDYRAFARNWIRRLPKSADTPKYVYK